MIPINERIKEIRRELGLSQYELADKLKTLNQSQLSKIETGNRNISVEDLICISEALGIPVNKLIEKEV